MSHTQPTTSTLTLTSTVTTVTTPIPTVPIPTVPTPITNINMIFTPSQIDTDYIDFINKPNGTSHILYTHPLFTMKSMHIVLLLIQNNNNNTKLMNQLTLLEYTILQKIKTTKYPIYNMKSKLYNYLIIHNPCKMFVHIVGIWENTYQYGLIFSII